jgi:hypothetical protein
MDALASWFPSSQAFASSKANQRSTSRNQAHELCCHVGRHTSRGAKRVKKNRATITER